MMQMLDLVEIGERVRQARRERKLSMTQVAEIARVGRTRIQLLETGKAPDVGFMNLQRICRAVGLEFNMSEERAKGRPTFEDLQKEAEQEARNDTPGLG